MQLISIFVNACITILSAGLLIISLLSYKKKNNRNLLFLTIAFIFFFFKGIILSLSLMYLTFQEIILDPLFGFFDVLILAFLFISTLKRQRYVETA
ncbi:MAG: hypothetical protein QXX20_02065 [Candidatus Thermoplasmatota archaeon]